MIKREMLTQLLNVRKDELQKFSVEQLRLVLGTLRYLGRMVEREINERDPAGFTSKTSSN